MLVAMLLEDILVDQGHVLIGPLAHLDKALHAARHETLDLAILDVNLNGQEIYPVAEVLMERGIPFAFDAGYVARPDAPGLGVEIDEEKVRAAAATGHRWRNPVWRREDGSVAEW